MIRATIFDLNGTLVRTERPKAHSYARATMELCPADLSEADVIAVATPFNQERLHQADLLPEDRIVDDPAHLLERVGDVFVQYATNAESSI